MANLRQVFFTLLFVLAPLTHSSLASNAALLTLAETQRVGGDDGQRNTTVAATPHAANYPNVASADEQDANRTMRTSCDDWNSGEREPLANDSISVGTPLNDTNGHLQPKHAGAQQYVLKLFQKVSAGHDAHKDICDYKCKQEKRYRKNKPTRRRPVVVDDDIPRRRTTKRPRRWRKKCVEKCKNSDCEHDCEQECDTSDEHESHGCRETCVELRTVCDTCTTGCDARCSNYKQNCGACSPNTTKKRHRCPLVDGSAKRRRPTLAQLSGTSSFGVPVPDSANERPVSVDDLMKQRLPPAPDNPCPFKISSPDMPSLVDQPRPVINPFFRPVMIKPLPMAMVPVNPVVVG